MSAPRCAPSSRSPRSPLATAAVRARRPQLRAATAERRSRSARAMQLAEHTAARLDAERRQRRRARPRRPEPERVRPALLAPRLRLPRGRRQRDRLARRPQAEPVRHGAGVALSPGPRRVLPRRPVAVRSGRRRARARRRRRICARLLADNGRVARLDTPAYSMVAYPWSRPLPAVEPVGDRDAGARRGPGGDHARARPGLAAPARLRADDAAPVGVASASARAWSAPTSPSTTTPTRSASAIASKPSRSTRCFAGSSATASAAPSRSYVRFAARAAHRESGSTRLDTPRRRCRAAAEAAGHAHPNQFALLAPASLRAVLLDPVPRRRQRQPVQVRVHGDDHLPAAGELAAAGSSPAWRSARSSSCRSCCSRRPAASSPTSSTRRA